MQIDAPQRASASATPRASAPKCVSIVFRLSPRASATPRAIAMFQYCFSLFVFFVLFVFILFISLFICLAIIYFFYLSQLINSVPF